MGECWTCRRICDNIAVIRHGDSKLHDMLSNKSHVPFGVRHPHTHTHTIHSLTSRGIWCNSIFFPLCVPLHMNMNVQETTKYQIAHSTRHTVHIHIAPAHVTYYNTIKEHCYKMILITGTKSDIIIRIYAVLKKIYEREQQQQKQQHQQSSEKTGERERERVGAKGAMHGIFREKLWCVMCKSLKMHILAFYSAFGRNKWTFRLLVIYRISLQLFAFSFIFALVHNHHFIPSLVRCFVENSSLNGLIWTLNSSERNKDISK